MSRPVGILLLIAVMGSLPPGAARAGDSAVEAKRAVEVRKKLAAPITFNGVDDPDAKLSEALEYLHKITDLTFEINEQAFKDEMIDDVGNKPLGRAIPKTTDVPAEKVLNRILARIPTSSGTTFVVRGGVVEIATRRYASPSLWRRVEDGPQDFEAQGGTIFVPQTSVAFDKRDLREALQEIADAVGVNIVVDVRAQDKGKTPITATLRNADVDTVVNLLADMADLQTVLVNDVFYVTTKENAKVLREKKTKKSDDAQPPMPGAVAK
jgi:hypothetical protein